MGRFDALTTLDTKPAQSTPLSEKTAVVHPTSKQVNLQTRLHANQQTNKDAKMQTGKPASMQTSKQVNLQTGKQVFIEKYSSYLTHEYKRELKRIAFESDRNEYEVLMEAVEQYLARQKQPK
jgi:trehalose/maltose hydrolase-like predicted phosphorylase